MLYSSIKQYNVIYNNMILLYNNNKNNKYIYIYLYGHFILIGKLMGNPETDGGNALFSGNRIHNMISLHWDHFTPVHQPKTSQSSWEFKTQKGHTSVPPK